MPIVISRDGELNLRAPVVTPEQREAIWAAFVTSWLEKHPEEFQAALAQPAGQTQSL